MSPRTVNSTFYVTSALLLATVVVGCTVTAPDYEDAQVTEVVDGDTLVLENGETVRLLDINTPEEGRKHAEDAERRLADLVLDRTVQLEQGSEDRDQYGRLLRYVHIDGMLVNEVLVSEGLATTYYLSETGKHRNELSAAEEDARQHRRGMWSPSPASACIELDVFNWNAEGNDNQHLNDEYVMFRNTCSTAVTMEDWSVKDDGTNRYTFPEVTVEDGSTVTLHTGTGADNSTHLYWGRQHQAVWNNNGDSLYLRDANEDLVLHERYHGY